MLRRILIGVLQIEVGLIFVLLGAIALEPSDCTHRGFLSCFDLAWMDRMAVPVFLAYIAIAILAARAVGRWIERRSKEEDQR